MARSLDQMLQPGEQVVFETGWRWRRVGRIALWSIAGGALLGPGWAGLVLWADPALAPAFIVVVVSTLYLAACGPLFVGCISLFSFAALGATVVVTDMRLLYRSGPLSRQVIEIPLWHIQMLDRLGPVVVRDRSGERTVLFGFYDARGLAAAICGQTGVPGPVLLEGRTRAWVAYGRTFQFVLGMASMSAVMIPLLAYSGISEPATDLPADGASPYAPWIDLAAIVLTVSAGAIPAMAAGFAAGPLLLTLAMRAKLSAGEARQVLPACEDHGCDDPSPPSSAEGRLDKLDRLPFAAARWFASLLYGERI